MKEVKDIELGETGHYVCECCGQTSETAHGYIYGEKDTIVYFIGYTIEHLDKWAHALLSFGGWGEGTSPSDRRAVALFLRAFDDTVSVEFVLPESSRWYGKEIFGSMLEPSVLTESDRQYCRETIEIVLQRDVRVRNYFANVRDCIISETSNRFGMT